MKLLGPPLMPEEATGRISWFIRLRWLAAAGVLVFAVVGHRLLQLQFAIGPFVVISISIALYNAGFLFLAHKTRPEGKWSDRFASIYTSRDRHFGAHHSDVLWRRRRESVPLLLFVSHDYFGHPAAVVEGGLTGSICVGMYSRGSDGGISRPRGSSPH